LIPHNSARRSTTHAPGSSANAHSRARLRNLRTTLTRPAQSARPTRRSCTSPSPTPSSAGRHSHRRRHGRGSRSHFQAGQLAIRPELGARHSTARSPLPATVSSSINLTCSHLRRRVSCGSHLRGY
jgi:hypothetical protein